MGGGGGKGGGGQTSGSRALERISEQLFAETTPIRGDIIASFGDILRSARTGGAGANVPLVQQATEQTLRAGSEARRLTEEDIARTGLAGTPFGQRILAEQGLASRQAVAGVPTQLFREFLPSAQNLVLGTGQTVVTGLGSATAGQSSLAGQRARAEADKLAAIFSAGGTFGGAAAACWIADELYGIDSRHAELARLWIFSQWRGPVAAVARWTYRRFGKRIAAQVREREWLRQALLPWFDRAVENAKHTLYEEWLRSRPAEMAVMEGK